MSGAVPVPELARDLGDGLDGRLEFETLISDTSAALFAARPERMERAVEEALTRVRVFFEADRCALIRVRDPDQVNVRLASYSEGTSPVPPEVNLAPAFPWAREKVLFERTPVRVSRLAELPPEAALDRRSWEQMEASSSLLLPVETAGTVGHLIVIQTVGHERDWPGAFVTRLRTLGELLVGALERSAMVAELREAEARVNAAVDSAGAGLWKLDRAAGIFWASERARELFGYSPDEVVTLARLRASVHPDDWHVVGEVLEGTTAAEVDVEYRIVLPDGHVRWISSRGRRQLEPDGAPGRLTGAIVDITQRRQAEEAFRRSEARLASAADLAGLAFYEVDFSQRVAYVDARFRDLCGIPPDVRNGLEPVDFWLEHMHPDDRPRIADIRKRFHDGRLDQASMEYRYRHPAGGERWIDHLGRVSRRDATGRAAVTYGVLRDITDRKRADEERADLTRRLIRAHEDERALLARELHDDVTQRLAVLAIEVGRAEAGGAARMLADTLRVVREGLATLSDDVHAIAYNLHPSVLDELGLVDALRTTCERFRSGRTVALSENLAPVPEGLSRDAALALFRVAQEALANAARHARARSVSLALRPSGGGVLLAVRDDGVGFDPARSSRSRLGLVSMRERLELLNGTFQLESAPGRGTAITAWVPAGEGAP